MTLSVLSLVVSILAVFVARSNVQRQIQVTAREAWMREFREQVAALLTSDTALRDDPAEKSKIRDAMNSSENTIRLLLAEKGQQNKAFIEALDRFLTIGATVRHREALTAAATEILQLERAAIQAPGTMERALRSLLGRWWRPLSRLGAWLRRDRG